MSKLTYMIQRRLAPMSQADRRKVAQKAGLPFATVQKIAIGNTLDPQVSTWGALAAEFGIKVVDRK